MLAMAHLVNRLAQVVEETSKALQNIWNWKNEESEPSVLPPGRDGWEMNLS